MDQVPLQLDREEKMARGMGKGGGGQLFEGANQSRDGFYSRQYGNKRKDCEK